MRHRNRFDWFAAGLCWWLIPVVGLSVIAAVAFSSPAPAWAQDKAPAADDKVADVDEGADDALIVEETSDPPPAAETDAADETPQDKTLLEWLFQSLGISYSVVFLTISFTLVSLLVMNILTARREALVPMALVENFENLLNEKEYQKAYELAKSDESMLGQVLSAGLAKLSQGYGQAIEAMQETGEEENMKLEHRLSYIALIGTVSPMIGLLGTVQGMIGAFQVIATSATAPKPAELAGNISTALFTTFVGLMIAIPAVAAHNILRNRIARLVLEVGILSEDLMSRFSNVGAKKS
ncbi:MAG: MotA/TolQ/ExbB proton channel family protein [Pirellulales bacterium]|nr:MotA/TolQ/ExbB proton channel family protein [Pirellulales bacterium]